VLLGAFCLLDFAKCASSRLVHLGRDDGRLLLVDIPLGAARDAGPFGGYETKLSRSFLKIIPCINSEKFPDFLFSIVAASLAMGRPFLSHADILERILAAVAHLDDFQVAFAKVVMFTLNSRQSWSPILLCLTINRMPIFFGAVPTFYHGFFTDAQATG
jgi:hypothetical protein